MDELAIAHHEAGHAVATVMAFRKARWLPLPAPLRPVRYVEINERGGGNCQSKNIYSTTWSEDRIAPRYRDLMERQIVIELAGGIGEAIYHGERRSGRETLRFAEDNCAMTTDLTKVEAVLGDLSELTGYPLHAVHFADRTLEMLLEHWPAVEALAEALVEHGRIEGDEVEAIIDAA